MCDSNQEKKRTPAEQARLNGAKSKGPATPEGKLRSSFNALKSGAYASHTTLLANEDPVAFQLLSEAYIRRFRPADPFDHQIVRQICHNDWLISRYEAIETSLLDSEIAAQQFPLELQDAPISQVELATRSVDVLLNRSRTLAHVQRQIHNLNITRQRLLKTLNEARRQFPVQEFTPDLDIPLDPGPDPAAPVTEPTHELEPATPATERTREPAPGTEPAEPSRPPSPAPRPSSPLEIPSSTAPAAPEDAA